MCVGSADWDAELWTNQQHLMSRLAESSRVLFVESLGLRRPQLARRDLWRMARRLRRGVGSPRAQDGVRVLSPMVLPAHGSRVARRLNRSVLRRSVGRAVNAGQGVDVLWGYVPQAEALIDSLQPRACVYHCVDDLAAQPGVDAAAFRAAERRYLRRCDLVLASAPGLAARLERADPPRRVVLAPNVADHALFARALKPGPVDAALARLPCPRIVFCGAIVASKLDLELMADLARRRPRWSFAMVGPIGAGDPGTDVSELRRLENVHFLGPRRHHELVNVLRGADAGIIPYAINSLTTSVFPMKVYEYLGAGLPVVATPLPSLRAVEGVTAAGDAAELARRLDELMGGDGPAERERRSRLAAGHSWDARIDQIARLLEPLLDQR